METHVWHAKRFAMEDKWGFKVPEKSRDKACRTVYRLSQRDGACITDQSFYRMISITDTQGRNKIKEVLNLKDANKIQPRNLMENETNLLCPISALVLKDEIMIFVHPAAFFEVLTFLTSLSIPF
jgi:hypothetical protein